MTHEWTIRPRFESAPYRPSPARREAIHGRIQPMDDEGYHPALRLFLVVMGLVSVVVWWL